jgi:branched-chain amino acid transport system substrate-binding protein
MSLRASLMLVALVLLAGDRRLEAVEDATAPPLLIGLLLPPEEPEAASLRRGVELGIEQANQSAGAQVALLVRGRVGQWGDDGQEAARMVLDDGVRGLIAPPGGAPSHLALQVAGRTATPVISLCPDSSVVGAGIPWMVRIVPSTREEARLLFTAYAAGRPFRWSALVPTERAGREAASDLRHAAVAAGSRLDKTFEVTTPLPDSAKVVQQILSTEPDGILLWLDTERAGRLARALRAAGFNGPMAGPGRLESASFLANARGAAEGFVLPSPVLDPASQTIATRFAEVHRQRFGSEPDAMARAAYDAALLLAERLGTTDSAPAHHSFPITGEKPGASGNLKFDADGNRVVPLRLVQVRNESFAPIATVPSPP